MYGEWERKVHTLAALVFVRRMAPTKKDIKSIGSKLVPMTATLTISAEPCKSVLTEFLTMFQKDIIRGHETMARIFMNTPNGKQFASEWEKMRRLKRGVPEIDKCFVEEEFKLLCAEVKSLWACVVFAMDPQYWIEPIPASMSGVTDYLAALSYNLIKRWVLFIINCKIEGERDLNPNKAGDLGYNILQAKEPATVDEWIAMPCHVESVVDMPAFRTFCKKRFYNILHLLGPRGMEDSEPDQSDEEDMEEEEQDDVDVTRPSGIEEDNSTRATTQQSEPANKGADKADGDAAGNHSDATSATIQPDTSKVSTVIIESDSETGKPVKSYTVAKEVEVADMPDFDEFIKRGNERRVSNANSVVGSDDKEPFFTYAEETNTGNEDEQLDHGLDLGDPRMSTELLSRNPDLDFTEEFYQECRETDERSMRALKEVFSGLHYRHDPFADSRGFGQMLGPVGDATRAIIRLQHWQTAQRDAGIALLQAAKESGVLLETLEKERAELIAHEERVREYEAKQRQASRDVSNSRKKNLELAAEIKGSISTPLSILNRVKKGNVVGSGSRPGMGLGNGSHPRSSTLSGSLFKSGYAKSNAGTSFSKNSSGVPLKRSTHVDACSTESKRTKVDHSIAEAMRSGFKSSTLGGVRQASSALHSATGGGGGYVDSRRDSISSITSSGHSGPAVGVSPTTPGGSFSGASADISPLFDNHLSRAQLPGRPGVAQRGDWCAATQDSQAYPVEDDIDEQTDRHLAE